MKKQSKSSYNPDILREKAEYFLKNNPTQPGSDLTYSETLKLIHELQVHQIEMEMQKDELEAANEKAEVASKKYSELYDFAPSGYFTLSEKGKIIELNLRGAQSLGEDRNLLIGSSFSFFVSEDTKAIFDLFLSRIFLSRIQQTCEITLTTEENSSKFVYLTGIVKDTEEECIVNMVDISERRQIEKDLRESEEQNHSIILQTAMDGFWVLDKEGRLLEVNDTYCRMSGYNVQELLTMHITDLEANEGDELTTAHIEKILMNGEDRFETRHRRKDGSFFDVEISVQYQPIRGGRLITFLHDITQRKMAEENLRLSEERYRSLFQGNHSVILLVNSETGEIRDANPAASLYYGWTHSELCSKNISEINTLTSEEIIDETHKAKCEKRNYLNLKHQMANGEIRDVELYSGSIIYSKSTLIYSIVHDATERRKAEEALRESEQRLKYHFENSPLAVVECDNYFVVTQWSIEAEHIFGWNKEEIVGNRIDMLNLIYEEDLQDVTLVMQRLASGIENTVVNINRNVTKSGSIIDCIWYNSILLDQNGQMSSVMSLVQDITKQKQAEEALKQLNEKLEYRVIERTAELLKLNATLQQTEQKYRTVADHTYDWEYWISEEDQIQYMSPSVKRITGYSAHEFITNPQLLSQIVFQDDIRIWKNHTAKSHIPDPNKKNDEIEFRIVTKTNDIRWIAHVCRGIFLDGKYHGLRVSNRDITEKVNVENELLNVTFEVEERERNRFSLELHDDLGPLLSTIKLYFQWLSETNDPKKLKIITERGNNSINRAIQTTREIAHGLGTQILNNVGFVGAILQFTQSINETKKLVISFKYNSTERFGNLLEITLYRITSELINNTLKYANATHVEIDYNCDKERNTIIFTYIDNGIGFNLDEIKKKDKGLGLMNIQQRVKLVGGSFSMETSVGNGIRILIQLPIEKTIKQAEKMGK